MATLSIKQKPLKINYNLFNKTACELNSQIIYSKVGNNLYFTNGVIAIEIPYNEKELETFINKTGAVENDRCNKILMKDFSELEVRAKRTNIIKRYNKDGKLGEYFYLENNKVVKIDIEKLKILDKLHVYDIYGSTENEPLLFDCGEVRVLIMPLRQRSDDVEIVEFIKTNNWRKKD